MARKRNKMKVKVHQFGSLRIEQIGRHLIYQNTASAAENAAAKARMVAKFPELCAAIDARVEAIRSLVASVEPRALMIRAYFGLVDSMIGKSSESEFDFDDSISQRMVDYIQSVVASTSPAPEPADVTDESWESLRTQVSELYRELMAFDMYESAYREKNEPDYTLESDRLYTLLKVLFYGVRGTRYPVHQIPFMSAMLTPHDAAFNQASGVDAVTIVSALGTLLRTLTHGAIEQSEALADITQEIRAKAQENPPQSIEDERTLIAEFQPRLAEVQSAERLFDVGAQTSLPEKLLRHLAYSPGEYADFFSEGKYRGWPLRISAGQVRPFLKIGGRYLMFDGYALFDNIYRALQRALIVEIPSYKNPWNDCQRDASEALPLSLLTKLLPGATVYQSIYYEWRTGTHGQLGWCECDGVVLYGDHLFIVEVKAKAYSEESPSLSFDKHIESLKRLIESPANQAARLLEYLSSAPEVTLWGAKKRGEERPQIATLKKSDFRIITCCGVSVDNLTTVASQAEKLLSIGLHLPSSNWSVSVDSLMAIADIFNSPIQFLHFVEQRQKAARSSEIFTDDELDHVALYLAHNWYSDYARQAGEELGGEIRSWPGYRASIDEYFGALYVDPQRAQRPGQPVPRRMVEIINHLEHDKAKGFCEAGSSLLDAPGNFRDAFDTRLDELISASQREGIPKAFTTNGLSFLFFTHTCAPQDETLTRNYIMETMVGLGDERRLFFCLDIDHEARIRSVSFNTMLASEIPADRVAELRQHHKRRAQVRADAAATARKVGPNEKCPCGSSKKYKRCHGA